MTTFREAREALLLANDLDLIDDEEMLLLYDLNTSKNLDIPDWKYDKFELDSLSDDECKSEFRFLKHDIYALLDVLNPPDKISFQNRFSVNSDEALCLLLRRFAYPCRRHDTGMLAMSGLLPMLETHCIAPTGQPLCLYGHPAYPLRVHLQGPFKGAALTAQQQLFNLSMSTVRTAVEWVFGDILEYFSFLDFKRNLKVGLSAVGKMYIACALLRNAHSCTYESTTSTFFGVDPPSLEQYFS
ncbi:hypothetical protein AWC38_SpisGene20810 [Stylophora pistillata]|uniref:DDE Tnp4 domain-containing protein n=1 Tax=Stylophora pistillata TaxID=50429 RepID=A0A2B4RCV8_STYPI|nr:hypothetical protein AWC38_SpisGene20810 [Stylophora pistillata]